MENQYDYYDLINAVQKWNHRGAIHMERGEYQEAIDIYIKALQFWEQEKDTTTLEEGDQEMSSSYYYHYDIDDCILQQQQKQQGGQQQVTSPSPSSEESVFDRNAVVTKGRRRESLIQQLSIESQQELDSDINEEQDGFIYSQPVRIPPTLLLDNGDGHHHHHHLPVPASKNTLSLTMILNVAMAHHLRAVQQRNNKQKQNNNNYRHLLEKALRLYELAHETLIDLNICSPKATIIISNNVGEIHRAVNNTVKHTMCLRHLLSTMMYMVDNNQYYLQQQQNQNNQQELSTTIQNTKEWDGFLRNTSQCENWYKFDLN